MKPRLHNLPSGPHKYPPKLTSGCIKRRNFKIEILLIMKSTNCCPGAFKSRFVASPKKNLLSLCTGSIDPHHLIIEWLCFRSIWSFLWDCTQTKANSVQPPSTNWYTLTPCCNPKINKTPSPLWIWNLQRIIMICVFICYYHTRKFPFLMFGIATLHKGWRQHIVCAEIQIQYLNIIIGGRNKIYDYKRIFVNSMR